MKIIFALALLLSCLTGYLMAANGNEAQLVLSCMTENGVTPMDVEDLRSGKLKPEDVKDNFKCATQCFLVKLGFMDASGTLQNDKILQYATDPTMKGQMETALSICGNTVGANPCDTAFQISNCFGQHVQNVFM